MRPSPAVAALACAALLGGRALPASAEEEAILVENVRILPVSGPPVPKGALLLRGGRIEALGETVAAPAGARRFDGRGGTVTPGFVDAASRLPLASTDRGGGAREVDTPAADGADLADPAMAVARAAGVTSLLLSPGAPRGTFAGRCALVKTSGVLADAAGPLKAVLGVPGPASTLDRAAAAANLRAAFRGAVEAAEARERYGRELARFLAEAAEYAAAGDAPEEAALPPEVLERLRRLDPEPREAARRALRARLGMKDPEKPAKAPKRPAEPREDPARALLLAATRGEVPVRFEAHAAEEVRAALALAAEFGLRASLEGGLEAPRAAAALGKARIPFACWPSAGPGPDEEDPSAEEVPGLLAAAGVPVAVATGDAAPLGVRHLPFAAALAAGAGLDRAAALRALTLDAAAAAGFEKRIGSLEPGKDADLLLWEGDPLAPGATLKALWIDGVERWRAEDVR